MASVSLVISPEERAERERDGEAIRARTHAFQIVDGESFDSAGQFLQYVILPMQKQIKETFRPRIQQAHQLHKALVADETRFLAPWVEAEHVIRERRLRWSQEQEDLRLKAEAAAQRERQRQEAELRAAQEAERTRLQAEAETERLRHAIAAEMHGDSERVEKLLSAPIAVPEPEPVVVLSPPPSVVEMPKTVGFVGTATWKFEITDATLIPKEYLIPDEQKIGAVVRTLKGRTNIPGVRAYPVRGERVTRP